MPKVISLDAERERRRADRGACEGRVDGDTVKVRIKDSVAELTPEQARTWAHGLLHLAGVAEENRHAMIDP